MTVVKDIFPIQEKPAQGRIQSEGNAYCPPRPGRLSALIVSHFLCMGAQPLRDPF
jgi:hypothetical protein